MGIKIIFFMQEQLKQNDEEKYEGASRITIGLAKLKGYEFVGSTVGGIVGGIAAVFNTKEAGPWSKRATTALSEIGIHIKGKTAIVVGSIAASALIGKYIGMGVGLFHGLTTTNKGRIQYERIKTQRDDARQELTNLKTTLAVKNREAEEHQKQYHEQEAASAPASEVTQASHEEAIAPGKAEELAL
jgi:hypothetical protein